jgi:hypothetical protein
MNILKRVLHVLEKIRTDTTTCPSCWGNIYEEGCTAECEMAIVMGELEHIFAADKQGKNSIGPRQTRMQRAYDGEEFLLCAAVLMDDGLPHVDGTGPGYPKTGVLFAGIRHSEAIRCMDPWREAEAGPFVERNLEQFAGVNQGFLTSKGRYVDRVEGAKIAVAAGQVPEGEEWLSSEGLY